jgi:hypothetical protein
MVARRITTELDEEIRLPAGGSFVITDELGNELFRVTAVGDATKVAGSTISANAAVLAALTATAAELNKLHGSGAVVASGTAAAHIADIATNATGTQIATAVNAIFDVLEAFGQAALS